MLTSDYQAALYMHHCEEINVAHTVNLAASLKPGSCRVKPFFISQTQEASHGDTHDAYMPVATSVFDLTPGPLVPSGLGTDVALEGQFFFELTTPTGEKVYTYAGRFHFNEKGDLVSSDGFRVSNPSGGTITKSAGSQVACVIDEAGVVLQGDQAIGQIGAFAIPSLAKGVYPIEPRMGGFALQAPHKAKTAEKPHFIPFAYRASNIVPVVEMSESMRNKNNHLEATKIFSTLNELMDSYMDALVPRL